MAGAGANNNPSACSIIELEHFKTETIPAMRDLSSPVARV
jgi:hypothetical protein